MFRHTPKVYHLIIIRSERWFNLMQFIKEIFTMENRPKLNTHLITNLNKHDTKAYSENMLLLFIFTYICLNKDTKVLYVIPWILYKYIIPRNSHSAVVTFRSKNTLFVQSAIYARSM